MADYALDASRKVASVAVGEIRGWPGGGPMIEVVELRLRPGTRRARTGVPTCRVRDLVLTLNSMFENRNRHLDLLALGLACLTLVLGLSLVTYDRADPPSSLVYPPNEIVQNACGKAGATVAHLLLEGVGIGAYYILATLAIVTTLLLARRPIDQPIVRAVGWGISLIGFTSLASLTMSDWTPGPLVGAGGYLGAVGRAWLEANFAQAGALIFTLSVITAGLLLSTDYLLFSLAASTTMASGRSLAQWGKVASKVAPVKTDRVKTDLEDDFSDELEEEEGEADDEEYEYEYEEEDWEEDEESEGSSQLAVRTPNDKRGATTEPSASDEDSSQSAGASTGASTGTSTGALKRVASRLTSALSGSTAATDATPTSSDAAPATPPAAAIEEQDSQAKVRRPKPQSERDEIMQQLQRADLPSDQGADYELPPLDLLEPGEDISYEEHEKEVRRKAKILERTFKNFGFNVKVVEIETGPVIAQYEVQLEAGLRLSKITGLSDDLAIALRVPSVRIVAPIPGKNTVGIEVPNEHRQLVRLREVIEETNGQTARMKIPIFLGKDVAGNPMAVDLAALPHLLIAGRTGTGKSVCLNSIIVSMLMTRGPDEVRRLMIDPKMVELSGYRKLPHLMHPVVTDMKKAEAILAWAVDKMEERYALLARAGVRHISVYNQLGEEELRERVRPESEAEWEEIPRTLPFVVIVADEMADLMMTAGKDVEQHIIRLAQKSRAVGIHLILATQKPTVDVITGLIKSNLPARIAFQVASRTDSRVVLDENGADKLLGNGDMLFLSPGTSTLLRGQGTFLSDDEITRVVDCIGTDEPQFAGELMQLKTKEEVEATAGSLKNRDELYEAAVDVVVREGRGSVSLLQRALGIGYGRAARLVDFMAEDGIVGQYNGSQAREVVISIAEWEAMRDGPSDSGSGSEAGSGPTSSAAPHSNRIVYDSDQEDEEEEEETPPSPAKATRSRTAAVAQGAKQVDAEEAYEEEEYEEEEYEEDYEGENEQEVEEESPDEVEYESEYESEYEDEGEGEYEYDEQEDGEWDEEELDGESDEDSELWEEADEKQEWGEKETIA